MSLSGKRYRPKRITLGGHYENACDYHCRSKVKLTKNLDNDKR